MTLEPTTNFKDSNGTDLGTKLVTKDYLLSVYSDIATQIGATPELWVWGRNFTFQLGDGTANNRSTPVTTTAGGSVWIQVSSPPNSSSHAAAIKTDGTLWVWGDNSSGQLGNATTLSRSTPVTTFAGGTNWRQVICGSLFTAAIKTDGTLWTWGSVSTGTLGNGATATNRSTPITTFAGGNTWRQVSGSYGVIASTKTDGTLWIWGTGSYGRLGNAQTTNRSTPVTTFAGGNNWKQVSVGGGFVSAIKNNGTLWTWGSGENGQLGNGIASGSTPVTTFAGGTNWKQVNCGGNPAAIKTDGTLWTWGGGLNGELGNNQTTVRTNPITTFAGGTNWKQVSVGLNHVVATKTDGTLWTWGDNQQAAQLGINDSVDRLTPVTTFYGGTDWKQVSAGTFFTIAIKSADFI